MRASWFETRGVAALLTMRDWNLIVSWNLILRSIAARCVSKDEAIEVGIALARERLANHDGHVRLAIRLGQQQDSGVEPAVMDDRILGIA